MAQGSPDTPPSAGIKRSPTRTTFVGQQPVSLAFCSYRLVALDGAEKGAEFRIAERAASLGSDPDSDVALTDSMVSRTHAQLEVDELGYRLDDRGSKNGTYVGGRRVISAYLADGDEITLGRVRLQFRLDREEVEVGLSQTQRLEGLVGQSRSMRELFALIEKVAATPATVLIQGETGVGKELVAEALHALSSAKGPLVVFDCSAVSPELVESELFGHVKGAFTGAEQNRQGAFRTAEGGTLFLDEVGELPSELQPKLLRALEKREIRPVGSDRVVPIQTRIMAATHRSLEREVQAGAFRSDLYYRLAVVKLRVPPLRERSEDIPLLVAHFLGTAIERVSFAAMQRLMSHPWTGNVRELRNYLTRAQAVASGDLDRAGPPESLAAPRAADPASPVDTARPFKEAKEALVSDFERRYWRALLEQTGQNLSEAARIAGVHRKSAEYVVQKLGLRQGP